MTGDKDRATRLVEYLMRLASLRAKIVRDLTEYDQVLWIYQIPREKGCFTRAWGPDEEYDQDVWIEIKTTYEPGLPPVPEICQDWVDRNSIRNTNDIPALLNTITRQIENPAFREGTDRPRFISKTEQLDDQGDVKHAWDKYVEQKWMTWAEQHEKWAKVHRVYSNLFAIHQEQLRLGEEYELVLGLGLLTWQTPCNQRVKRHLVVVNALLEFEARLGKFTLRPNPDGSNLRLELDMLEIEDQPARAEETAKESFRNVADDPWDKDCVEGVLKSLIHSISPNGEYHGHLDAKKTQFKTNPIVEYAPALILRKHSLKGLTDVLKRIKDRIEGGEDIPPQFADLAEITDEDTREQTQSVENQTSQIESEIYFPKHSNEEQRRIVEKIRNSSGVLVQGPPGTGKSHTIANLICHLLATGQRILITAKTPRALQVLVGRQDNMKEGNDGLLPKELRPLCISLLGSGLEEKRSMETSVRSILRENEDWNGTQAQEQISKQEKRLRQLREEKVIIDRKLRAIRESETHSQNIVDGIYRGTAAQIAQTVDSEKEKYGWFNDKVPFEIGYPFNDIDLIKFMKGLRWLTLEKQRELSLLWPISIDSTQLFKELVTSEQKAAQEESKTSIDIDEIFFERISNIDDERIRLIHESLYKLSTEVHRLKTMSHTWVDEAIRDVSSGSDDIWREMDRQSSHITSLLSELIDKADTTDISLPADHDPKRVFEDAVTLKKHLEGGGKLGWGPFRPKAIKPALYIIKKVKVNGCLCCKLEHAALLEDVLRVRIELGRGWNYWNERTDRVHGPYILQYRSFQTLVNVLRDVLSVVDKIELCKEALSGLDNLPEPLWHNEKTLQKLVNTCKYTFARINKSKAENEFIKLLSPIATIASKSSSHPLTKELLSAIRLRNIDAYNIVRSKIEQLGQEKKFALWVQSILKILKKYAPLLSEELLLNPENTVWNERIHNLYDAWHWSQARYWLEDYIRKEDAPSLEERALQIEDEIGKIIAQIASLRAWSFCFSRMKDEHRRHMESWQQEIRKLGKGTGKHAPYHRREAQKQLNECREAVPAWVMPLHRVWDTVAPAPGMFDVIIVDEASQCGFEALPLLYLGKKILIVGDDKQISPEAVGIPPDIIHRLMDEYLHDFIYKASFDVVTSIFDHVKLRYGTRRIALREHFRCMPEIIRFSNDLCYYDNPLKPLRQYSPDRLIPINHVSVQDGRREGSDSRVINRQEAKAIVDKIVELCSDEKYLDKTMGVIVLQGDAQANLIEGQLLDRMGAEEMQKRRLICGNPYSFQGDERDIIFLSMVAATNERIGSYTKTADERRFNVAASRARDQMWLFHSVNCNDLSESCLRRRLLEFFENTKIQKIAGIDCEELRRQAKGVNRSIVKPPNPFDSWFEVDVALEIAGKGYQVIPQYEVAGKHIDLVIVGGQGGLIAVECDGDEFHGIDQYDNDMQRQRVLERCRWVFSRIRASEFYADSNGALKGLWRMLEERGITPQSAGSVTSDGRITEDNEQETDSGISDSNKDYVEAEHEKPTGDCRVEIGDTVVYVDKREPDIEKQVLINREQSNPEWGTINIETPMAQSLLGSQIGDTVEAKLPMGIASLFIKEIKKNIS